MRKLCVVLFLVACGDDGVRHTPDASRKDGATDSPADAAPNPVTLTVRSEGQPVAGIHVYFQNADSSVVLATTTDASGTASAVMQAGGYVTAIDPYGQQGVDVLDTFAGVKPGDHLVLQRTLGTDFGITVNVSAPSNGSPSYMAYSPCNNGGTTLLPPAIAVQGAMTLSSCGSATDFLVIATNGSDSAYLYAPNIAIASQGNVDLSGGTYTATTPQTLTYTNLPSAQALSIEEDILDPMGTIYLVNTTTATGQPSAAFAIPDFAGSRELLQTSFNHTSFGFQTLFDWGQLGAAFTTDVAARALHGFAGAPAYDPATHVASIAEDTAAGGAADFSIIGLTITRAQRQWLWSVAAPYSTAGVPLPTLPTDVFDFNVGSGDTFNVDQWTNVRTTGGYDAARAFVLSMAAPQDFAAIGTGAATFSTYQQLAVARTTQAPPVLRHRTR